MKIIHEYPPNIESIRKALPAVRDHKHVVFTYGDAIHNPSGGLVPSDVVCHEEIHSKQQKLWGVRFWWFLYLHWPYFRFRQELSAYRVQFQFFKKQWPSPWERMRFLDFIAGTLAGDLYGNYVTKEEAKALIATQENELFYV